MITVVDLCITYFFFLGIDAETAYTRNDYKTLKGDMGLRKQVKLKNMLGYCTPLILESNGLSLKFKSHLVCAVDDTCDIDWLYGGEVVSGLKWLLIV